MIPLETEHWTVSQSHFDICKVRVFCCFFSQICAIHCALCILVKGLFMLFNIINSIDWIPSCILCNVHLMKMVCTWIFELFVLWILFSLFYVILFERKKINLNIQVRALKNWSKMTSHSRMPKCILNTEPILCDIMLIQF